MDKYIISRKVRPVDLALHKSIDDYQRKVDDERNRAMTLYACSVFKQLGPENMAKMELVEEVSREDGKVRTVWFFRKKESEKLTQIAEQTLLIEKDE